MTASCPLPAETSSRLYPTHALYQQAEPDHHVPITDSTINQNTPTVSLNTPIGSTTVTHLKRSDVWISQNFIQIILLLRNIDLIISLTDYSLFFFISTLLSSIYYDMD